MSNIEMEYRKNRPERFSENGRGFHGQAGQDGMRRKTGEDLLNEILGDDPNGQLLFVGSVNCLRHKPYLNIGKQMKAGRASILCPSMTDFSTGRYLQQIADAIVEIAQERNAKRFTVTFGCQWVILSTDGELLQQMLKEQHGIDVTFFDDSHLEFGDHR